jgi:predicted RNA-binding Zn-ribbon protein involved in translation (DUF1610 family)
MSENNRPFDISQPQEQPIQQRLESVSKAVGFDIPVESVILPSKGLIYSPEHPLCNTEMVEIKCMTAKEEDLLTSRALIKNGTVISKLLQSCILNKSVNAEDLLIGDRNAILINIRISGYGPEYSVRIDCPQCGEEFDNEFSLSGLKIKTLQETPLQPNTNAFSFVLPLSKKEVVFKLLTGKDETEMATEESRARKKLGALTEKNVTSRLFHSILSIDGINERQKISYIVNNLRAGDSRALRKHIDKIEPDIEMKQFAFCPHCGEESEYPVPLSKNFFFPEE